MNDNQNLRSFRVSCKDLKGSLKLKFPQPLILTTALKHFFGYLYLTYADL